MIELMVLAARQGFAEFYIVPSDTTRIVTLQAVITPTVAITTSGFYL